MPENDLLEQILSEFGSKFGLSAGEKVEYDWVDYSITPTYSIRLKGLFNSTSLLLGAKTVLMFDSTSHRSCGYIDNPKINPPTEINEPWIIGKIKVQPEDLKNYKITQIKYIPETVQDILSNSTLREIKKILV